MLDALAVSAGAAAGALTRFKVSTSSAFLAKNLNLPPPFHIAAVNVAGSLLLGGIAASTLPKVVSSSSLPPPSLSSSPHSPLLNPRLALALSVGFCGSLTTFSTFSLDALTLLQSANYSRLAAYLLCNNVGGIAACALGYGVVRQCRELAGR